MERGDRRVSNTGSDTGAGSLNQLWLALKRNGSQEVPGLLSRIYKCMKMTRFFPEPPEGREGSSILKFI